MHYNTRNEEQKTRDFDVPLGHATTLVIDGPSKEPARLPIDKEWTVLDFLATRDFPIRGKKKSYTEGAYSEYRVRKRGKNGETSQDREENWVSDINNELTAVSVVEQ